MDFYEDTVRSKAKRSKKESTCIRNCIICGKLVPVDKLTKPKDESSWLKLLNAAKIRRFTPILELSVSDNDIPDIYYETECRNNFSHKKSLEKLIASRSEDLAVPSTPENPIGNRLTPKRTSSANSSTVYASVCIFCDKVKFLKTSNNKTREKLIKCVELRADQTVRNAVRKYMEIDRSEDEAIVGSRILALTSRDIVAAEAHYHVSCYKDYTRQRPAATESRLSNEEVNFETSYDRIESKSYDALFDFIRDDMFQNPRIEPMSKLIKILVNYMINFGATEIRECTKNKIRRKLDGEFGPSLNIFKDAGGRALLVMPDTLSKEEIARNLFEVSSKLQMYCKNTLEPESLVRKAALHIRNEVKENCEEKPWPPLPNELDSEYTILPNSLECFLTKVLAGESDTKDISSRVQRLVWSFGQDIIYGVTGGKVKTAKHLLLPWVVKSLTGNVELMTILNRLGHGTSYHLIEEIDTALCLRKIQRGDAMIPDHIHPRVPTVVAFDNIDRLEETLSGSGTSHRINGIIIQPQVITVSLPLIRETISKDKRRTIPFIPNQTRVYDCGDRISPPPITPIEPSRAAISESNGAKRKNVAWTIIRQTDNSVQKVPSWTGFNILVNDKKPVSKDSLGYLPTINEPATSMAGVFEILKSTKDIMIKLDLPGIVVVMDQAIYAKASELLWKNAELFSQIILRMGTFHTVCNLLSIIGKRFGDAGLRELIVESNLVAEGSIQGVLDGKQYNRGVRSHKLVYEAFLRVAWRGFQTWYDENFPDTSSQMEELMTNIIEVSNDPNDIELYNLV